MKKGEKIEGVKLNSRIAGMAAAHERNSNHAGLTIKYDDGVVEFFPLSVDEVAILCLGLAEAVDEVVAATVESPEVVNNKDMN